MLNHRDLMSIFKYLEFPEPGRRYVQTARSSPPSRAASGRFGNSVHTFASRKMGWTIKAESRHAEQPFLLHCEFSDGVLEYYDQPPGIKLHYTTADGKNRGRYYTPDFLVIENSRIYLAECKLEADLEKESVRRPHMYTKDVAGNWQCPPAIEAAKPMGLHHNIFTDHDFSPAFTRNCIYLLNFIDNKPLPKDVLEKLADDLKKSGGRLLLKDVSNRFSQVTAIQAILKRHIFADLNHDLLCAPDRTWIYADKKRLEAIAKIRNDSPLSPITSIADLEFHSSLFWGVELWEILNVSKGRFPSVSLRKDNTLITLKANEFKALCGDRLLHVPAPTERNHTVEEAIAQCRTSDLEIAHTRQILLRQPHDGSVAPRLQRSLRRWKKAYDAAEGAHGCGLLGLIPKLRMQGNRNSRLTDAENALIDSTINDKYLSPNSSNAYSAYKDYLNQAKTAGLATCSLQTFYKRIQSITTARKLLTRKGSRAAYAYAPAERAIDLSWDLPYHGDFIFEVAHVDHTPLEMQLWSKLTNEPIEQTVYLSLMIDGYSRTILAMYLTFEPPSYRSTMMLLRECYRRHQRAPLFLAVDSQMPNLQHALTVYYGFRNQVSSSFYCG